MTTQKTREDLATEYARLKERADRLDALIRSDGREWAVFLDKRSGTGDVVVIVDRLLAEARQTAIAMTAIARALANSLADKGEKAAGEKAPVDRADEIARKRAEKLKEAAGG